VTLPYNLLLQKSAREALGINLKDQIVLIDEAHSTFPPICESRDAAQTPVLDLIPTLLSLSTSHLSYSILQQSFQQVCIYVSKFKTRLSPVNMLHLKRLVIFLDALKKYVAEWKDAKAKEKEKEKMEVMTVGQLIARLGKKVSGINLLEIESYLKKSKVGMRLWC